jgi:hypothetical protein
MTVEPGTESMTVEVARAVGGRCIDEEDGRQIYETIRPVLVRGGEVELDFAGVEAISAPFLTAAVAGLLEEIPIDDLLRRLFVNHMTVRDVQTLRSVLESRRDRDSVGDCPLCDDVPTAERDRSQNA